MRTFLIAGLVALALVAAILYTFRKPILRSVRPPPRRTAPEAPPDAPPDRLIDVAGRVRKIRHAPETQQILLKLVEDAARLGPAAVEDLRGWLRDEPDVEFQPIWRFEGDRLRGFPTLRSGYLAALIGIPGREAHDALIEALAATSSAREAYLISLGLERRGEGGFTSAALDRAAKAGPAEVETAHDLVALAARADPEGTAGEIALRSPRGDDPTDPVTLAEAIERLPAERALATGKALCADPQVTRKAKERYLMSLCNRGEPETLAALRQAVAEGFFDRQLRVTLAYKAIDSAAFYTDEQEYARASPERRVEIRARFEARLREAQLLIDAAIPPGEGSAAVRESLLSHVARRTAQLR